MHPPSSTTSTISFAVSRKGWIKWCKASSLAATAKPVKLRMIRKWAWYLHQSLLDAGGWSPAAAMTRYLEWMATDPPDIGSVTHAALLGSPQPEAQGNGTLMRILPVALWAARHSDFDWLTAARQDAALTHPHPINGDCNAVYVYALLQAMQTAATPQGVYHATLAWASEKGIAAPVIKTLHSAATTRPDYDGPHIGWVLVALHSAFYQLLHSRDFRSALVVLLMSLPLVRIKKRERLVLSRVALFTQSMKNNTSRAIRARASSG